MKIGILTWHYYENYGSKLQTIATVLTLRKLGHDVSLLNYRNKIFGSNSQLTDVLLKATNIMPYWLISILPTKIRKPGRRFELCFFDETKPVYNEEELKSLVSNYDITICGSDQIWAPNVYNPVYMLDFVPDNVRKVSYAASIGLNQIPEDLVDNYKKYIGRLDFVSVREEQGKEILAKQCGIASEVVLDPTLLVDIQEWKKLEYKSKIKEPFIFCYFLNTNHQYKEPVKEFAKIKGLKIYGVSGNTSDAEWMNILTHQIVGPREFLGLINDATIVITDSYHGTIFSLLHHKDFILLERFTRDDVICQNSRIYQLEKYFGISENIVSIKEDTKLEIKSIDYETFESKLSTLRKKSLNFILKTLS